MHHTGGSEALAMTRRCDICGASDDDPDADIQVCRLPTANRNDPPERTPRCQDHLPELF